MNRDYIEALQKMAASYQDRIRSYVQHAGEKGRLHEHVVANLLRNIAPRKCSFGTGFIINSQGDTSPQCDIVVYDEQLNRPLLADMDVNVFPMECVYAIIEVKTNLRPKNLRETLDKICRIRKMAQKGKHYRSTYAIQSGENKTTFEKRSVEIRLAPRSYIVSFGVDGISLDTETLRLKLTKLCNEEHKHFHGLTILGEGVFATRLPHEFKPPKFRIESQDGLTYFLRMFLGELRDYPMDSMDVEKYIGN